MGLNPFKTIFPKKNAYKVDPPSESQFSSELSPESAQYSTGITNTAVSTGMTTAKVATVVGVSSAIAIAVAVTVIATTVILTGNKSETNSSTLLGYQSNCTTAECNTYLGLICINNTCLCNSTQYYSGSSCGLYFKINKLTKLKVDIKKFIKF
jgi:hypothetical protein